MPSKGVQVYSWIANPGYTVRFAVPGTTISHTQMSSWSNDHIEVDSSKISGWTGTFSFTVTDPNNAQVIRKANDISTWSGNLEGGDMTTLENMQSLVAPACIVTFGFYDSGSGLFGLPNFDQCWVTVTPNWSNWIGVYAPLGSPQASKPFTTLVLPSAHDVGMNSISNCMAILSNVSNLAGALAVAIGALGPIGAAVVMAVGAGLAFNAKDIITGLSITQKDSLSTMLQTGARYFEFRPAHVSSLLGGSSPLPDELYFQHLVIPGMAFKQFLSEVVGFLTAHPAEIVVVQIRFDGIHDSCRKATPQDIDQYIVSALTAAPCNNSITRGYFADMKQSIDALRNAKKRLIVLTDAQQYSTYSDGAYATLSGASIEQTFPAFLADASQKEAGSQIAVWQCQATSTNVKEPTVYAAMSANSATSTLLCTKPLCDTVTLPWLQQHVFPTMPTTTLQAIMNDFFDGSTADVAIELSRKYLNQG